MKARTEKKQRTRRRKRVLACIRRLCGSHLKWSGLARNHFAAWRPWRYLHTNQGESLCVYMHEAPK